MSRCVHFICLFLLVVFTNTFIVSCVFESDDEYFNKLPIPNPNAVGGSINVIDLANVNQGDTIDVSGTTLFKIKLTGTKGNIESATVFLGDKEGSWNKVSSSNTSSFTIPISELKDGTFVLKLDLITDTKSGSLADAVGAEKFNITLKWIVRIDLSAPPIPVPTLSVLDGFLTLEWSAYDKSNFQSYIVTRKPKDGPTQSFEIKDKKIMQWRDENYVGGYTLPIEYSVSVVSETGRSTSVPISRNDPMNIIFSFNSLDSTFTLKWKPTKLYGTFKNYAFTDGNAREITTLTNLSDSTLTYKLSEVRFGAVSYVGFKVHSKSEGISEYPHWNTCKLGTPLTFEPVGEIRFNPYLNKLVAVDADNILFELNEKLEPVNVLATLKSTSWRMPYPGNYVYSYGTPWDDNTIYRLKLEDNSEVSYDNTYNRSNTVASNGLICTEYFRPSIQIRPNQYSLPVWSTNVIDPAGGSNVYNEYSNTTDLTAVISEDGRFIRTNGDRVFRTSSGTSELVGSFTPAGSFFGFRQDNSAEMIFRNGNKIDFYDVNSFTLLRSISPPATNRYWYGKYDVQTKNMLWTSNSKATNIYTVNIETGLAKSIEVSDDNSPTDFYMVNGLLISNGYYIKVQ